MKPRVKKEKGEKRKESRAARMEREAMEAAMDEAIDAIEFDGDDGVSSESGGESGGESGEETDEDERAYADSLAEGMMSDHANGVLSLSSDDEEGGDPLYNPYITPI